MHGIGPEHLQAFISDAQNLSKQGWRTTTLARVSTAMGASAASQSHREVVKKVLNAHLIDVQDFEGETEPKNANVKSVQQGRGITRQLLIKAGIAPEVDASDLCETARLYVDFEKTRGVLQEKTIFAHAKYMHRFINFAQTFLSTYDEITGMTSSEAVCKYQELISNIMAPNTLKNNAAAMISVLQLAYNHPAFKLNSLIPKPTIKKILRFWVAFKNDYEKRARIDQRRKLNSEVETETSILDIVVALNKLNQDFDIRRRLRILSQIPRNSKRIPEPFEEHWKVVTCVLGVFLMLQGARLWTALGLKTGEIYTACKHSGTFILRIACNKTANWKGHAVVALKETQYAIFRQFAEIRQNLDMGNELLVTTTGRPATNLLNPIIKILGYPITFNMVRKTIETNCYVIEENSVQNRQEVASYLCHSTRVADTYYRFKSNAALISEAKRVESILSQVLACEIVKNGNFLPENCKGKFIFFKTFMSRFDRIVY